MQRHGVAIVGLVASSASFVALLVFRAWEEVMLSMMTMVMMLFHLLQTITSLCLDGSGTRLLSGALDGHVKVYDLQSYGMVYGMKYPSPILSMACAVRRAVADLTRPCVPTLSRPRSE